MNKSMLSRGVTALAVATLTLPGIAAAAVNGPGGGDPQRGAIYRGVSRAVRFDVSPPLRELVQGAPAPVEVEEERFDDPPSGLEGPLGPQDTDPLVQVVAGLAEIPSPNVSFDGISGNGPVPPDSVGDVGPDHYVAMVNLRYAVYDKAGNLLLGPLNNNTLWAGFGGDCEVENAGDPIVLYDQLADRWLLTQFTSPNSPPTFFNCVALSTSGDPTGTYFRWAFPTSDNFPDYPKYGVWPDAYYVSTREFDDSGPFEGIGAYALDRAQMILGNPSPQIVSFLATPGGVGMPNIGDGLLPADLDGFELPAAGTPNFYLGSMDDGGPYGAAQDALTLWKFHVDFAVPANSTFTLQPVIAVAAFDSIFPCGPGSRDCIPQPTTPQKVDHQGYRQRVIHRNAYRKIGDQESLVTNQSVEAAPDISGIRWYEIRDPNGTPTVFQQGTYAPGALQGGDGIHRWFGSIAMDASGNMALGYSASNATTTFPSVWYTGRLVDDPLGTLPQGEGSLIDGTGSQTTAFARWGDYSSMNIDPVDDCTFWYVTEWVPVTSPTGWRLRIGSFTFPTCESAFIFDDGFETGDTSAWDQAEP